MAKRKQKPTADIVADLLGGLPEGPQPAAGEESAVNAGPAGNPAPKAAASPPADNAARVRAPDPEKTPAVPTGPDRVRELHFVAFKLGRRHYALPLGHVAVVLRMVAITPLPEAPVWVAGVFNLHGRVVPVVDIRQQLGHEPRKSHRDDRLLVVSDRVRQVALMVEDVARLISVAPELLEQPELLNTARPVVAVVQDGDHLTMILDAADLILTKAAAVDIPEQMEFLNRETGSRDDIG